MAQTSSPSASNPKSPRLFPVGTRAFLLRRLAELAGLLLFAASVFLGLALFSYTPADPSFNTATGFAIENLMGPLGAHVADVILQAVGAAGLILPLVLLAWSWALLSHHGLRRAGLRIVLCLIALLCMGFGLSSFEKPNGWPLVSGLGGVSGDLLLGGALQALDAAKLNVSQMWLGTPALLLGAILTIAALGMSRSDWFALGHRSVLFARLSGGVLQEGGRSAFHGARDAASAVGRLRKPGTASLDDDISSFDGPIPPRAGGTNAGTSQKSTKGSAVVVPPAPKPKQGKNAQKAKQPSLFSDGDGFQGPSLALLSGDDTPTITHVDPRSLEERAEHLASVLEDYGVNGEIVKVRPGPVVTLYELEPAPGIKTSRVVGLADDIARSMSAISVRVAVVPGRNVIGIELPNQDREMVGLRELLASETFEKSKAKLPLILGKDIGGGAVTADLATMPHLLIAGTTGSGKSVGMNAMILSLLYRHGPEACRLIMIDPKMLELSVYEGIPHLLTPVVTEPKKAVVALKWAVREMEERYRLMSQMGVRNIAGYNQRIEECVKKGETLTRRVQTGFDAEGKPAFEDQPLPMETLPFIVVVVDEMADLMLVAGKDVEAAIQRLAQMARAAGIHLIMATQRPSVDVITGTIKANFPTRISFQVTSKIDSRTILGEQGAEQLLGKGDMLYMAGGGRITRVHGPFVSDEEVEAVVEHLKTQGVPEFIDDITKDEDEGGDLGGPGGGSGDELYDQALALVAREGKASTSFVQRHLSIGYNRAAKLIEKMEQQGVVSTADRVGRREVLIGDH